MKKLITIAILTITISSLKLQNIINNTQNDLIEISSKVEEYIKSNRKVYYLLNSKQFFKFEIDEYDHIFKYSLYSYINCAIFSNYKVEVNGMFYFYDSLLVL